jgi:hypothetical protein
MTKALEVNQNSVGDKTSPSPKEDPARGKRDQHDIAGKSLQVNENSVENTKTGGSSR